MDDHGADTEVSTERKEIENAVNFLLNSDAIEIYGEYYSFHDLTTGIYIRDKDYDLTPTCIIDDLDLKEPSNNKNTLRKFKIWSIMEEILDKRYQLYLKDNEDDIQN